MLHTRKKVFSRPKNFLLVIVFVIFAVLSLIVYVVLNNQAKVPKAGTVTTSTALDQLVADSWGHQDYPPAGVPSYYNYANTAYHQEDTPPSDKHAIAPWLQVTWANGISPQSSNARVQFRQWRAFVLVDGKWVDLLSQNSGGIWSQAYSPTYGTAPAGATSSVRNESEGWSWVISGGTLFHATPGSHPALPAGTVQGALITVDMRIIADDSTKPFSAQGLIGDAGGDWRISTTSTEGGALPPIVQGAWRILGTDWRTLYASSVPETTLRANLPPILGVFPVVSPAIISTPTPTPTSQVSSGKYSANFFNNTSLTGSAVASKTVFSIVNNWGSGAPTAGVNTDNFSARYSGTFNFDGAKYRFNATADDGVRVYIDGSLVINAWKNQAATSYSALFAPSAGTHTVTVEYYDQNWDAVLNSNFVHTSCADMTGDGVVGDPDYNVLKAHWNQKGSNLPWDINVDGKVNYGDFTTMLNQWGKSCN